MSNPSLFRPLPCLIISTQVETATNSEEMSKTIGFSVLQSTNRTLSSSAGTLSKISGDINIRSRKKTFATLRLGICLFVSYFDILTDLLVSKSYYDAGDFSTAYATGGFIAVAVFVQANLIFINCKNKPLRVRLARSFLALLGLGPLVEGFYLLHENNSDSNLIVSQQAIYSAVRSVEVICESFPEAAIQLIKSMNQEVGSPIQAIRIISIISSIVSGTYIITDLNFLAYRPAKYRQSRNDPFYNWKTKAGPRESASQFMGMFIAMLSYFCQFVLTIALVLLSAPPYRNMFLLLIAFELLTIYCYKASDRELFGVAVIGHPSFANSYLIPIFVTTLFYVLACLCPVMISASPLQLGPRPFSGIILWRLLTNGIVIFFILEVIDTEIILSTSFVMELYAYTMAGVAVGLWMFLSNCDKDFDVKLLFQKKSGKEQISDCWQDDKIWSFPDCISKEHERWYLVNLVHPLYLPFEDVTLLIENLAKKYEDRSVERPKWLGYDIDEREAAEFIDRIKCIYEFKGVDGAEGDIIDNSLNRLFGDGAHGGYMAKARTGEKYKRKETSIKRKVLGSKIAARGFLPQPPSGF
ncbi:hypothetical protein TrVE_jg3705 [Triparma verrucosa]|uniref:Uncharacterized protein n=1 Tax=Triparma verrucosa TaxID=1606542 RepID=A0A9W7C1J1_9STRA|nr:hypothetical protein TrVE_jg3705 [Triparma verrucosa]